MSALITFSESNVAEVVTDSLTNINFGGIDMPNIVPSSARILKGSNSYEKYIRIKVSGFFEEISNMKFWKYSGEYLAGEVIKAIANQVFAAPVKTASIKAVNPIPITEGAGLSIESTEVDPALFTATGYSKYIVLQTQTTEATPTGSFLGKQFYVSWDEI